MNRKRFLFETGNHSITDITPSILGMVRLGLSIKDISRIVDLSESRIKTIYEDELKYDEDPNGTYSDDDLVAITGKTYNDLLMVISILFYDLVRDETDKNGAFGDGRIYLGGQKDKKGEKYCILGYGHPHLVLSKNSTHAWFFDLKLLIDNLVFLHKSDQKVSPELTELLVSSVVKFKRYCKDKSYRSYLWHREYFGMEK